MAIPIAYAVTRRQRTAPTLPFGWGAVTVLLVGALLTIIGIVMILYGMIQFFTGTIGAAVSDSFSIGSFFSSFFGAIILFVIGGVLAGATLSGVLLALFMANAGGAWDNAKKFIEAGAHGGKGSPAHKAGVVGDTVGDPFKDTAGPSLHVLIKLLSTVTLVLAPLFV